MDFGAMVEKVKKCVFLINEKDFEGLASDRGLATSFVYLLLVGIILAAGNTVVQLLSAMLQQSGLALNIAAVIISAPVGYVIFVVGAYVWMAIMHVLLKIVGGKAQFLKTAQVYIYGMTPTFLFGWIPLIGFIAGLVGLANVVIGAKKVHGISLLRAIIAIVVIPMVVIVVLMLAAVAYLTPQLAGVSTLVPGA